MRSVTSRILCDSSTIACSTKTHMIKRALNRRYSDVVEKNAGLFLGSLKKVLATMHCGCHKVWVLDSESVAFRPFSFSRIFHDYWHVEGAPIVSTDSQLCTRLTFAVEADPWFNRHKWQEPLCKNTIVSLNSKRLLGLNASDPIRRRTYERGAAWDFNDYWHWDVATMHQAASMAIAAQGVPTLAEAFGWSPASAESFYYTYVAHSASGSAHAVHSLVPTETAAASFYAADAGGLGVVLQESWTGRVCQQATRCQCNESAGTLNQVGNLLRAGLPRTCELLASKYGFHGVKWPLGFFALRTTDPSHDPCAPSLDDLQRAARALTSSCGKDDNSGRRYVEWLLSFELSLESLDDFAKLRRMTSWNELLQMIKKDKGNVGVPGVAPRRNMTTATRGARVPQAAPPMLQCTT